MKYGEFSTNARLKLDCKLKKKRREGILTLKNMDDSNKLIAIGILAKLGVKDTLLLHKKWVDGGLSNLMTDYLRIANGSNCVLCGELLDDDSECPTGHNQKLYYSYLGIRAIKENYELWKKGVIKDGVFSFHIKNNLLLIENNCPHPFEKVIGVGGKYNCTLCGKNI